MGSLFDTPSSSSTRQRRTPPSFPTFTGSGGNRLTVRPGEIDQGRIDEIRAELATLNPSTGRDTGDRSGSGGGIDTVTQRRRRDLMDEISRIESSARRSPEIDVSLGEEGRNLRNEALAGTRGLLDQTTKDIDTLRGLENPFIQARVRPLEQARDERTASLTRDVRRRSGFNSITEGFIGGQERLADQQIGDQRAIATQESQQAIRATQAFAGALNEKIGSFGQEEINQSLAELQLGQNAFTQFLNSMMPSGSDTNNIEGKSFMDQFGQLASIAGVMCSREWKDVNDDMNPDEALDIVNELPVVRFSYKEGTGMDPKEHVATFAEDFGKAVFDRDGQKTIDLIDYIGLLHASIKSLTARIEGYENA